ncbi:glycogen debranching N-terminal domain-containing protein [soil metagenome]
MSAAPALGALGASEQENEPATEELQPMLHDLTVCLAAPTTALSAAGGQIGHRGAQGVFSSDVRVLCRAEVSVGGRPPETISDGPAGRGAHHFVSVLRHLGDRLPDTTVRLDRRRQVTPGVLDETLTVSSAATREVVTVVELVLATDFAGVEEVKQGWTRRPVPPRQAGATAQWCEDGLTVRVTTGDGPHPAVRLNEDSVVLSWQITVAPRSAVHLRWGVTVTDPDGSIAAAPDTAWWPAPVVRADDRRLAPLIRQSLDDLYGLRMVTRSRPGDVFLAAGSPWYLTLFGRDSLWAARMLLPLGAELAAGTLRTLAARQGGQAHPHTQEQPGRILHELRRSDLPDEGTARYLPAQYYGTVDATPLWVLLLHDAWRWGLPAAEVEPLLEHAVRALDWVVGAADPDGDGFLEYVGTAGSGLANQGWKDSGDSVRFGDGRIAEPPIALCEVQGYAYEAARRGAELLEAFGRTGTDRYHDWAEALRTRFRQHFWVTDGERAYPAMALDGAKARVDSLTSNVGHLLGTGLLDDAEAAQVVGLLAGPEMDSGYGLRTMSSAAGGYNPLSYHCGSVWPHDTAVVVTAMARAGYASAAAALLEGLLSAGAGFAGRLPELYSGERRAHSLRPVPYPAACRPQAWSAAAAVSLVEAILGLRPDVPAGRLRLAPARPSPVGRLRVEGLRIGAESVTVEVDGAGGVVEVTGTSLRVEIAEVSG